MSTQIVLPYRIDVRWSRWSEEKTQGNNQGLKRTPVACYKDRKWKKHRPFKWHQRVVSKWQAVGQVKPKAKGNWAKSSDKVNKQRQDTVQFVKEAEGAIRSFYATQAGACLFTTQINYIQRGYGICCKRNKPMLALDQQRNLIQELNIQYISFHKKGWLKTLNMQQQNRLN